jgi:serine/threonine-protein kinase HipA
LSPAYDVTHSHAPDGKWTRQHLMAVNGRSAGIGRIDVMEVGDRFAVPGASGIVEQVLEAVAKWRTFADEAGVPEATAQHIAADIDMWSAPLRA